MGAADVMEQTDERQGGQSGSGVNRTHGAVDPATEAVPAAAGSHTHRPYF